MTRKYQHAKCLSGSYAATDFYPEAAEIPSAALYITICIHVSINAAGRPMLRVQC